MKKISVIIPCYNCANTIKETLYSIYNQTYRNIEIIAINDGSTDNTWEVLQELKNENNSEIQLQIYTQNNKGQSNTRNNGTQKATGDYLLFLDADDIIENTYLEKCTNAFDNNKKLKLVYSKAQFFGALNEEWKLPKFNLKNFLLDNCIYITALIRTTDFKEVGGFDESLDYYEDWELWIKLINSNEEVYQIPEFLFKYRKHNDKSSITDKGNSKVELLSKNRLTIYLKHIEKYEKQDLSFEKLFENTRILYKNYYNVWYRKFYYKFLKPKKYSKVFKN